MGTSPDQLRNEIEQTRAGLTHNVDTLAEKVSPSAVAHRRVTDAKGAMSGIKDKVMGSSHMAAEHLGDAGASLGEKASDLSGTLADRASSAPGAVRTKAQGNPLAAGIIAFGAGLLVSSLMPSTEAEQQAAVALKQKTDPLVSSVKEQAKAQAQELKESLAPAAHDALDSVKSTAGDAAAATKDHATSAVSEVAQHAQSAAADTKANVAEHAADAKDELSTDDSATTVHPSAADFSR